MSLPRPGHDYCPSCYGGPGGFYEECRCSRYCRECEGITNHSTRQHRDAEADAGAEQIESDDPLVCPDCGVITNDGERCGECISYMAGFYTPEGD